MNPRPIDLQVWEQNLYCFSIAYEKIQLFWNQLSSFWHTICYSTRAHNNKRKKQKATNQHPPQSRNCPPSSRDDCCHNKTNDVQENSKNKTQDINPLFLGCWLIVLSSLALRSWPRVVLGPTMGTRNNNGICVILKDLITIATDWLHGSPS